MLEAQPQWSYLTAEWMEAAGGENHVAQTPTQCPRQGPHSNLQSKRSCGFPPEPQQAEASHGGKWRSLRPRLVPRAAAECDATEGMRLSATGNR